MNGHHYYIVGHRLFKYWMDDKRSWIIDEGITQSGTYILEGEERTSEGEETVTRQRSFNPSEPMNQHAEEVEIKELI